MMDMTARDAVLTEHLEPIENSMWFLINFIDQPIMAGSYTLHSNLAYLDCKNYSLKSSKSHISPYLAEALK